MPSLEGLARFGLLMRLELRQLLISRAFLALMLAACPLVGYGFVHGVALYAEASKTALQFPELAKGMTPLDGILVPSFGAFYLLTTLIYPFVAIRSLAWDRQTGGWALLVQTPLPRAVLIAAKLLAALGAWTASLAVPLAAVVAWLGLGGHVSAAELANLVLGHAAYAVCVSGIALFAAALTDAAATAAIVALAATVGVWALDFAAAGATEAWLRELAEASPTAMLRQFERGVFAPPELLRLVVLGLGPATAGGIWLATGRRLPVRLAGVALAILVTLASVAVVGGVGGYRDVTEDRRQSFNPADEQALARMDAGLLITIHLSPEDSRYREFNANVLTKLTRLVPRLTIRLAPTESARFAAAGDEAYGLVTYDYAGRHDESRSTSGREILPLLHGLAGVSVKPVELAPFRGYPLVADAHPYAPLFFAVLPLAAFGIWWWLRRRDRVPLPSHLQAKGDSPCVLWS